VFRKVGVNRQQDLIRLLDLIPIVTKAGNEEMGNPALTYPVLFVLALIFIGPTIPIDISILVITSVVAAIGLSTESSALPAHAYIVAWRSKVLSMIRAAAS